MKWILFFLLFGLTTELYAANFLKGEGRFTAKDGDSYEFIKGQLIHEAIKSIVTKKIEAMGLNSQLYWEKYNEKLDKSYADLEENLRARYNINEKSKASQIEKFNKNLRYKKFNFRKKFGKMNKMLSKYAIKKISRSQSNPNFRMIRLEGNIDTGLLTKEYYKLIRGVQTSDYGTLFFYPQFQLNEITYSEIGIENEKDFNGEISKNWLNWFISNKPGNIANIELMDSEKKDLLKSYMKIPNEQVLNQAPEVFVNSLLVEIDVQITKVKFESKLKSYEFTYKSEAFIRDLQSNLVIGTYKLPIETKYYHDKEGVALANLMANHVYQMVRSVFPKMIKNVKELSPTTLISKLELSDFQNTKTVKKFVDLAEERGVKYSLKMRYESLNKEKANLLLYFDGTREDIKNYLEALKSAKKDLSYEVVESGNTLGIKFNKGIENL